MCQFDIKSFWYLIWHKIKDWCILYYLSIDNNATIYYILNLFVVKYLFKGYAGRNDIRDLPSQTKIKLNHYGLSFSP